MDNEVSKLKRIIVELILYKYVSGIFHVEDLYALYEETCEGYADEEFNGIAFHIANCIVKNPKVYKYRKALGGLLQNEFLCCFHDCINQDRELYRNFAQDILNAMEEEK